MPLDPAQVREEVATDLADRGQRERIDARQRAIDAQEAELTAERAAMRQLPEDVGVEDMTDEQLSAIYGATMHAPGDEVPA